MRTITISISDSGAITVKDSSHPQLEVDFEKNRAVDELIASVDRAIDISKTEES